MTDRSAAAAAIPAIEREIQFRSAPERLWRAITEPDELAAWFGQRAAVDLRPGGAAWFEWDDGGRFNARVELVEPPRRFSFRWAVEAGEDVDAGRSTLVTFEIVPGSNGGSRLRLRESGFATPDLRFGNVRGWMDELHDLLELVADHPWDAGIRKTFALRSAPERVWAAIATVEGLDQWFGPTAELEMRPGSRGWFVWEKWGRFPVRIEAVEAPRYLAWSWSPDVEGSIETATTILRTEWYVAPRADGGSDLHLLETGPFDEAGWTANSGGWDSDVIAGIRRVLGEASGQAGR
jgi:uncharacterized protein YndB with AHSA1/START domain